uniref:Uncharacterized protein n=1 Tax=Anguilla anguilla TaxID=7936 RepID=A0A0E9Q6C0_ANGAN
MSGDKMVHETKNVSPLGEQLWTKIMQTNNIPLA